MQSIREGSTVTQFVAFQTIVCSLSPTTISDSLFDTAGLCSSLFITAHYSLQWSLYTGLLRQAITEYAADR